MTQPILFIGLDGYDPVLGEKLMAEGKLPALKALRERSARVGLEHGAAKRTGLAWEHFATGLDPVAADRYSAVHFDTETYDCVQRGTRLPPFTRDIAADTVIFDAPYLDLTRAPGTRGMIGWGAHDPGVPEHSHPRGLAKEIESRFGTYPAPQWIYGHTWPSPERTRQSGRDLVRAVERRAEISSWLFTERCRDWRLAITVVSELHSATEALWHGIDESHPLNSVPSAEAAHQAMIDVYVAVDRFVEKMLDDHPQALVVTVSIHGMGPNDADIASMAALPELLYRRAFGEAHMDNPATENGTLHMPPEDESWSDSMRNCFRAPGKAAEADTNGASAASQPTRRKRSQTEKRLRDWAKSVLAPVRHQLATHTVDWMPANWYRPYWPEMDAFALPSFYDGQIRLNLKGREASGTVELSDYPAILDDLEAMLSACRDVVTGKPVVKEFVRSHRPSPMALGPSEADLIVVWDGLITGLIHPELGTIGPMVYRRPGGHTGGPGMAWVCGAGFAAGDHGCLSAFDVVPTLYELLGRQPAHAISGQSFVKLIRS